MEREEIIQWILIDLSLLRLYMKSTMAVMLSEQKGKLEELVNTIKVDSLANYKISTVVDVCFFQGVALEKQMVMLQKEYDKVAPKIDLITKELQRDKPDRQRIKESITYFKSLNDDLEKSKFIPYLLYETLRKGESLLREQTLVP